MHPSLAPTKARERHFSMPRSVMMLSALLLFCGVAAATPAADNVHVTLGKVATEFTVSVGGGTWLKGAPLRVFESG
jgi:hypothetical protein